MAKRPSRNGSKTRHSFGDYRRMSPDENERNGHSRLARHYVLKSVGRVTSRTPSISAKAHETLRVRQIHGMASPAIATQARAAGGIKYHSARYAEIADKTKAAAARKRLHNEILKAGHRGERVYEHAGPGVFKRPRRDGKRRSFKARDWHANYVEDLRDRRLAGEELDNGDWHMMMDYAERFNDPARHILRASPGSFGIKEVADDE